MLCMLKINPKWKKMIKRIEWKLSLQTCSRKQYPIQFDGINSS